MSFTDWLSIADAVTFFNLRYGAEAWAALTEAQQTKLLTTAYNRIINDPRWTLPTTPTAEQKAKLAYCTELLAWYMYIHIEDEDRRKGLQSQGVVSAGIVQESYDKDMLTKTPLPSEVKDILDGMFTSTRKPFYSKNIDRKEPVGADQNVADVDNSLNDSGVY